MRLANVFSWLWMLTGAALVACSGSALMGTPFLGLFLLVGWLLWGVQVWILELVPVRGEERSRGDWVRAGLRSPLVVLAVWFGSSWLIPLSSRAFAHVELWKHEARYEVEIERFAAGEVPDPDEGIGRPVIDPGQPLRVAFPWGTGITDNWRAIVYDPTGLVLAANRREDADEDAYTASNLFGGTLFKAVHLKGDYYYCVFT